MNVGDLEWPLRLAPIALPLAYKLYATLVHGLGHRIGRHTYWNRAVLVSDLSERLGPGVRSRTGVWLRSIDFRLVVGEGRNARVSFFSGGLRYFARFELDVDEAPRISMRRRWPLFDRQQPPSAEGLALEWLPFTFATLDRPRVARAFQGNLQLKGDLIELFTKLPLDSARIWSGKLTATAPLSRVQLEDFRPILERLDRIAKAFERVPVKVRVLGGERRALRGASGGARCAYCHDGITGDEADLVACELCHTVLHDECWRDLGHCPVLGCAGRDPERPSHPPGERARS